MNKHYFHIRKDRLLYSEQKYRDTGGRKLVPKIGACHPEQFVNKCSAGLTGIVSREQNL